LRFLRGEHGCPWDRKQSLADLCGYLVDEAYELQDAARSGDPTASAEELSLLPGVGPARARAIVELRQQRGGFKRVEDLLEVKGIGEAGLAKLKPFLAIEGKSTLSAD